MLTFSKLFKYLVVKNKRMVSKHEDICGAIFKITNNINNLYIGISWDITYDLDTNNIKEYQTFLLTGYKYEYVHIDLRNSSKPKIAIKLQYNNIDHDYLARYDGEYYWKFDKITYYIFADTEIDPNVTVENGGYWIDTNISHFEFLMSYLDKDYIKSRILHIDTG